MSTMATSAQIQVLLRTPDVETSQQRTLDFLNSRFKSIDDLNDRTVLQQAVDDALHRRDTLQAQLAHFRSELDALIAHTRSAGEEKLHTAQELSLLRHSLADELQALADELLSVAGQGEERAPTLLEDLEALHRQLKELESVKAYVQVVRHALTISTAAVDQVKQTSTVSSLSEYERLQTFVTSVSAASQAAEDAVGQQKLHIVAFLEDVRENTWGDIREAVSERLITAADKLKWPLPVDYAAAAPEDRKEFEAAFLNLLKLQTMGDKLHSSTETRKEGLYPILALVRPLALRFKYHFDGTRQTNRPDKPEWYFTHILDVAHAHRAFLAGPVQVLLRSTRYARIDAWCEFVCGLLPMLKRKLRRSVPGLLAHPPVLAHTIYQALTFDSALREEGFELGETMEGKDGEKWEGVSDVILGRKEWFDAWVEGERKFSQDQYMEIITAPDAWQIADDEAGPSTSSSSDLRPTTSARRVSVLIEQVTDRFSPLPQSVQRTRFLLAVQLPILEAYHARIGASLDAFETLSSAFMRAVPGALSTVGVESGHADGRGLTGGVQGVQRLCKALVSAKWMVGVLEGWGEELFFLELWEEITKRPELRVLVEDQSALPIPKGSSADVSEGTIFDQLVEMFDDLVRRAEDMIAITVCGEVEAGYRAHVSSGSTLTTPVVNPATSTDISLPPTLLAPIALFSSHLTHLRTVLPGPSLSPLYRRIASTLCTHVLQRQVLYRGPGRLAASESKNILAEAELWVETSRAALVVERAKAETPWRPLVQASRLLCVEGDGYEKVRGATLGVAAEGEWEEAVVQAVGITSLSREEVGQVLGTRADWQQ